jgi:hypothetical protein
MRGLRIFEDSALGWEGRHCGHREGAGSERRRARWSLVVVAVTASILRALPGIHSQKSLCSYLSATSLEPDLRKTSGTAAPDVTVPTRQHVQESVCGARSVLQ